MADDSDRQNVLDMLSSLNRPVSSFRREELNQLSVKYRAAFGEKKWCYGMDIKELWRSPLPQLTEPSTPELSFGEFEKRLATYFTNILEREKHAYVWDHVQVRIREVNRLGTQKIRRVRRALVILILTLIPARKALAYNRFEYEVINRWLDDEVFGA